MLVIDKNVEATLQFVVEYFNSFIYLAVYIVSHLHPGVGNPLDLDKSVLLVQRRRSLWAHMSQKRDLDSEWLNASLFTSVSGKNLL